MSRNRPPRATVTFVAMRLWTLRAPAIAYTTPAMYSCLIVDSSSPAKYSSTEMWR
jgi:hypothetical protein